MLLLLLFPFLSLTGDGSTCAPPQSSKGTFPYFVTCNEEKGSVTAKQWARTMGFLGPGQGVQTSSLAACSSCSRHSLSGFEDRAVASPQLAHRAPGTLIQDPVLLHASYRDSGFGLENSEKRNDAGQTGN